jgi:hypothetical protein
MQHFRMLGQSLDLRRNYGFTIINVSEGLSGCQICYGEYQIRRNVNVLLSFAFLNFSMVDWSFWIEGGSVGRVVLISSNLGTLLGDANSLDLPCGSSFFPFDSKLTYVFGQGPIIGLCVLPLPVSEG